MEFLLYTINLTSRIIMDIRFLRALQASFVLLVHISGASAASTQVGNTSVKCIERERQSLLAFKQGFVDPNNTLSSWGNEKSQKECCNWEDVECNESGHVNSLSLTSNGLKGALPKSLELCQLSILFLNGNYFSGRLDDFISAISCANESLQYLNLAGNQIVGPIPDLSQFSSLETLYLGWNQLNGTLSDSIGKLSSLVELSVAHNSLEGKIPLGTQLQSFDASAYAGNVELCGDPLPKCPATQIENGQHDANSEEDGQFFSRGFFISLSIGFGTGFLGACSLLFLNKSWRSAYFKSMSSTYDKVFVMVAINMAKLRRRNRVST